jgi:hypothetical protein
VQVVTPIDDAGGIEVRTVLRLPAETLRDLAGLLRRLPDDRYRIYLVMGDWEQGMAVERRLVREIFVVDGKPVELEEVLPGEPSWESAAPLPPPGGETDPGGRVLESGGADSGGEVPAGGAAAAAAFDPAAAVFAVLWQSRVDQAIASHWRQLRPKSARRCRRRWSDAADRSSDADRSQLTEGR